MSDGTWDAYNGVNASTYKDIDTQREYHYRRARNGFRYDEQYYKWLTELKRLQGREAQLVGALESIAARLGIDDSSKDKLDSIMGIVSGALAEDWRNRSGKEENASERRICDSREAGK